MKIYDENKPRLSEEERQVILKATAFEIGKTYFFRPVTFHLIGTVVDITEDALVLMPCVWVANSGRWAEAISKGTLEEIEVPPTDMPVILARDAISDAWPWRHPMPSETK